ncbi:MAG: CotH kinase family protein [Brevefilum sp.]|nr:CotH kinase family protein [Brevefilum sp.]
MKKIFNFFVLILLLISLLLTSIIVDRVVIFPDANLDSTIREILNHSGKPIYQSQLLDIVELNLQDKEISDLSGIEHFRNLEILNLHNNLVEDVSQLQTLYSLKVLDLGYNKIVNLEQANFHSIKHIPIISLNLEHNAVVYENDLQIRLSGIEFLGQFSSIQELNLADNHVSDFSALSDLKNLTSLNISENRIVGIDFLENMVQLRELNLRDNYIENISPLSTLANLTYLNLHSNTKIVSINPIKNLINLETLLLRNVPVGNELGVLMNLRKLERLNLRNCSITDLSPLVMLMKNGALQDIPELGIQAYLDILDNDFEHDPETLKEFVPYWDNIHTKYPYVLNYATLAPPILSKSAGFYSEPFVLRIESDVDNARIFYTLDGSSPSRKSNEYRQPVLINEALLGTGQFPKATIVRTLLFSEGFDEVSPVVTQSYFIGRPSDISTSLPIVSMAINPEYLFDGDSGLYVARNYLQRGMKWERPAHIEFFETTGILGFSKNVEIRIHGVESRHLPQKSFRIYANVDYDEKKFIDYEIFPNYKKQLTGEPVNEFETILLRNSGTEQFRTMFRDAFVQTLADQTTLDTQGYRPSILFLNGEYWGIFNIRERIDEYYIANHYLVNPNEVTILEYVANRGLVGDSEDKVEYYKLYEMISENDINNPKVYEKIGTMMDLDNFIDFQIIQIFSANMDWPQNNNVFWRIKSNTYTPGLPNVLDGRWRWILYDLDFAFHNYSLNLMKVAARDDQSAFLFRSLVKNEDFRNHFLNRFADLLNTSFLSSHVISTIEQMQSVIEVDIKTHIDRWSLPESLDDWYANIRNKKDFAYSRPDVMKEHLINYFDLDGTYEITFLVDSEEGYIRINSIDIIEETPGVIDVGFWSGTYFKNIPINISAFPLPGYRFIGWEFSSGQTVYDQSLDVYFHEDLSIRALFEPLDE